nr:Gfo/Idh/MocA family oxidoreductase [Streptomyces scabichelini]
MALVGIGSWGRQYLRIATRLGASVAVCHSRHHGDDARWLAAHYPAVRHTTSLTEALDRPLDAVAVVTSRHAHADITLECLRRGLHVLVEKPAVTNRADLERTRAEAHSRGLVLRTGYTHCFDESLRRLATTARRLTAPDWRFTWTRPAPGTGVTDLVWEYFPHVFSIAGLLGDVAAEHLATSSVRVGRGPSGTATVEVDLPMRDGRGHVSVSSDAGVRHKGIRLYDGTELVAVWRDRRLLDVRRNRVFEAAEEPLLCQIRDFLEAVASRGDDTRRYDPRDPQNPYDPHDCVSRDRVVTDLLVRLDSAARHNDHRTLTR